MNNWYVGTIGFTYPEWKGSFYPVGLPADQALNYYSKIFNAVEINTTFYGAKSPEQVQRWAIATPDDFRFTFKAPRKVTHELRLQNAAREMELFLASFAALGEKMGAVLIQLPPGFHVEEQDVLDKFLAELPKGPRYAVEVRHAGWHVPQTADLLSKHNVCWVATDYETLPVSIFPTTDFLYVRWIGKHNVIPHPGHEVIDRTARLRDWVERIQAVQAGVSTIFGFFDNDYAGHAPGNGNQLKRMAGLPVTPTSSDEQGRLF